MRCYKEITGLIVISLLVISALFTGMVSATTDEESVQNELSAFLLKIGDKDKEILFEYIEDSTLSDDEKNRLKEGMLDSWERYPNNTNQDYLVAEEVLNLLVAKTRMDKKIVDFESTEESKLQIENEYKMKNDPNLIEIRGKEPLLSSDEQKQILYSNLAATDIALKEDIKPYLYPNGSIIGYGWNVEGYFSVRLYKNMDITDSQINEIYNLINEKAIEATGDEVTVAFIKSDFAQPDVEVVEEEIVVENETANQASNTVPGFSALTLMVVISLLLLSKKYS